jgi:hypothetical protein
MVTTAWLQFLSYASYAITVIFDIAALVVVWPAFKRTRHKAFLLLAAGCALGVFDTICDHTIGLTHMPLGQYVLYRTLRRFAYFTDIVVTMLGIILLTRSYLSVVGKSDEATDGLRLPRS